MHTGRSRVTFYRHHSWWRPGGAVLSFLLLACMLFFPPGALAQQDGGPELAELMPKIYLAYGGRQALSQLLKNSVILGTQSDLDNSTATPSRFRQTRKADLLRLDIETGAESAPITTVFDGFGAWKAIGKMVEELPEAQAKILKSERDRDPAVITRYQEPGYMFKLLGRTTFHAAPVYSIEVSHDAEEPLTLFVDEKNYLVVAISYKAPDPVTLDFGQYRPAAGTVVPFKKIVLINDKPVKELDITSIDTAAEIADSQFRRPDKQGQIRLAKSISVPFEYSHKEVLVKVRLNGNSEPLDFLIDTAATQTVVDRRTAAENFLDRGPMFSIGGVGGAVPTQLTTIKKLEIGDAALEDVQALILDMTPQTRQMGKRVAGIIGANVLNKFAVTIEYGKGQMVFNDATTYRPPTGAVLIPFTQKQGPIVKGLLNATTEATFLIDTGAAFNNLPAPVAKKFVITATPHMTEGTGLDGRAVRLATVNLASVKLGTQNVKNVTFTYSVNSDASPQTALSDSNIGVLGNPFWQNFAVTMDYKFQRLVLQPNTVQVSRSEIDSLISAGDTRLVIHRDLRGAETNYQKALLKIQALGDAKMQARAWGRIGNLRRVMAKDLKRPEQSRIAYEYFSKGQELAHKLQDREAEGRILADWSLLYLDNGQVSAAQQALQGATLYAPQDPQVNVDFAVYLYKMQMYPDMQKYVEKALFLDPSNWQALWYKVKLTEMFSDNAALKETLKEILRHYPWSTVARDKLTALMAPPAGAPPPTVPQNKPVQQITPSH